MWMRNKIKLTLRLQRTQLRYLIQLIQSPRLSTFTSKPANICSQSIHKRSTSNAIGLQHITIQYSPDDVLQYFHSATYYFLLRSGYVPENIRGPNLQSNIVQLCPRKVRPEADSRTADRTLNAICAQVRERPHRIVYKSGELTDKYQQAGLFSSLQAFNTLSL